MTATSLPHILLLTHGGWGAHLRESLHMVTDNLSGVSDLSLMPSDTLSEFYQRAERVVRGMPPGSLLLTDFIGGTTSNVAARLSADYPIAAIAGLNASLLLQALDLRERLPLTDCIGELLAAGRESCIDIIGHIHQL